MHRIYKEFSHILAKMVRARGKQKSSTSNDLGENIYEIADAEFKYINFAKSDEISLSSWLDQHFNKNKLNMSKSKFDNEMPLTFCACT